MAQIWLTVLSIALDLFIIYLLLVRSVPNSSTPGGEAEQKPRRFITPRGIFAVESTKRSPKVNDDESLFEREKER